MTEHIEHRCNKDRSNCCSRNGRTSSRASNRVGSCSHRRRRANRRAGNRAGKRAGIRSNCNRRNNKDRSNRCSRNGCFIVADERK